MVLTADSHTKVVTERGEDNGSDAVVECAHLLFLETGGDAGGVKQFEHSQGIVANRTHVHRAVIVEAESSDGHLVGIVLHGLYFLVVDEVVDDVKRQVVLLWGDVYKLLRQTHQPLLDSYFFR